MTKAEEKALLEKEREFKKGYVKALLEEQRPIKEIAIRAKLSESTVRSWKKILLPE